MSNEKKGWPVVGQIVENTNKKGEKFRSVKFAPNVTILVDNVAIDMNKYRSGNLVSPTEEVERLIASGKIEENEQETRREQAATVNSWLKYNIVVPPQKG